MAQAEIFRESLEQQAKHVLEECRIIVPGIQALIGFQMIAIFNEGFYDKLSEALRETHYAATCLSVFAMFLLLTPSAYQRIAEPGEISRFFTQLASHLICWAMAALRLSVIVDLYVLARAIEISSEHALEIAGGLFILGWALWSGFPRVARAARARALRG